MKPVLSEQEKARITESVIEAEKGTTGEIVPLVVRASDHYPGARWRVAVAFMLLAAGAIAMLRPELAAIDLLMTSVPLLGIGHLLALWPPLLRLALNKTEVVREVRQQARESFVDLNVHATRDRTGVLILVSLLEHRIEILADTAIHAVAPDGYWDQVVAELSARIRDRDLAGGLAAAVERVGGLLAEEFPAREGEHNELPDQVLVRD
jgi:putative membrane protein